MLEIDHDWDFCLRFVVSSEDVQSKMIFLSSFQFMTESTLPPEAFVGSNELGQHITGTCQMLVFCTVVKCWKWNCHWVWCCWCAVKWGSHYEQERRRMAEKHAEWQWKWEDKWGMGCARISERNKTCWSYFSHGNNQSAVLSLSPEFYNSLLKTRFAEQANWSTHFSSFYSTLISYSYKIIIVAATAEVTILLTSWLSSSRYYLPTM